MHFFLDIAGRPVAIGAASGWMAGRTGTRATVFKIFARGHDLVEATSCTMTSSSFPKTCGRHSRAESQTKPHPSMCSVKVWPVRVLPVVVMCKLGFWSHACRRLRSGSDGGRQFLARQVERRDTGSGGADVRGGALPCTRATRAHSSRNTFHPSFRRPSSAGHRCRILLRRVLGVSVCQQRRNMLRSLVYGLRRALQGPRPDDRRLWAACLCSRALGTATSSGEPSPFSHRRSEPLPLMLGRPRAYEESESVASIGQHAKVAGAAAFVCWP